ncbi:hypothetical protein [Oceanobacillus massiliensis]|uniref:hypothetical protein n=1 Tax=Oceanobacillus massiliensis TaxID=1465765 RepID=UPI00164DFE4A|nr:hypothetical protein [Oceanobacillus massiliensis]
MKSRLIKAQNQLVERISTSTLVIGILSKRNTLHKPKTQLVVGGRSIQPLCIFIKFCEL